MSVLFDRDVKTIGKHIGNALEEELDDSENPAVAKFATIQNEGAWNYKKIIPNYFAFR